MQGPFFKVQDAHEEVDLNAIKGGTLFDDYVDLIYDRCINALDILPNNIEYDVEDLKKAFKNQARDQLKAEFHVNGLYDVCHLVFVLKPSRG